MIDVDLSGIEAAMYLRKSRPEDGMDASEILRRHKETLSEYAARNGVRIVGTYQEIQSGESLDSRSEMIRLLGDMEAGHFQAVLCMDIDRLFRSETQERGKILTAFKKSGTLIVTPAKVYDLSEESDELMAELYGLFSNIELRKIKERMKRGKIRAAKDGCFLVAPPYGYHRYIKDKKKTLEIYEPEARFVRMAFDLYADGIGCDLIAQRLNAEGATPRRAPAFTGKAIAQIITNPVYYGKIVYRRRQWTKRNGKQIPISLPESEWIVADGLHPAIIPPELWQRCRDIMKSRWRPAYYDGTVKAPLAGLIRCKQCGSRMYRRTSNSGVFHLHCRKPGCHCVSSRYDLVENAIMGQLQGILEGFETEPAEQSQNAVTKAESRLESIRASIASERRKMAKICGFLESGIYTEEVFRERMEVAEKRMEAVREQERAALEELDALKCKDSTQQAIGLRTLLDEYNDAEPHVKNALLHGIVDVIWDDRPTRKAPFSLEIFLR